MPDHNQIAPDLFFVGDTNLPSASCDLIRSALAEHARTLNGFTVGNFESTFNVPNNSNELVLISDASLVEQARDALGMRMVSLANNHSCDLGKPGLQATVGSLGKLGIGTFGLPEKPTAILQNTQGRRIGILGVAWCGTGAHGPVARSWHPARWLGQIKSLASQVDTTIVFVHWGYEFEPFPLPAQRVWARQFIDNGADFVIGAHPHVTQGFEWYRDRLIAYSLGNFIFPITRLTSYHNLENTSAGLVLRLHDDGSAQPTPEFFAFRGTHLQHTVEYFDADTLLKDLNEPLSMPLPEYRKWCPQQRAKWYIPAFDASRADLLRILGWNTVSVANYWSGKLNVKPIVKKLIKKRSNQTGQLTE